MSVKGLKEALAKKKMQQNPEAKNADGTPVKITPTAPIRVGNGRPQKKVTGRGR